MPANPPAMPAPPGADPPIGPAAVAGAWQAPRYAPALDKAEAPTVKLLLRLAGRFINLPLERLEAEIELALLDMGRYVGADRAYVFSYDFVAETASNTHEWCEQGIEPQREMLQALPFSVCPEWHQAHAQGLTLHVPDVAALPPGGLRDLLLPQGVQTVIELPLMLGNGACIGFVGFDFVHGRRELLDEEVKLLHLFAQMLVNVTERGRTETELRQLNSTLEARVAERTAELAAAKDEALAANRGKSAFMARMSHELRTPLNAVLGFSQLLALDSHLRASPTALQQLQHVRTAGEHLLAMVDELLDLARIEAGGLQVSPERLEVAELVTETLALVQSLAQRHQVRLQGPPSSPAYWVHSDRLRLRQVLMNLLSNAVKYNRAQGRVDVELAVQADGLAVTVRDTGAGMTPQQQAALFQPFNRLGAEAGPVPGTGLGLVIARQLTLAMGAQLLVHSVVGAGSRFTLLLPLAAAQGGGPADASSAAASCALS